MKKIVYDLETTNIIHERAQILELCAYFVDGEDLAKVYNKRVRFDKSYSDLDNLEIEAFTFNRIYNQKGLDKHNFGATLEGDMLSEFVHEVADFGVAYLTGWNNLTYDDRILFRKFRELNLDYNGLFHRDRRDVREMFKPFYYQYLSELVDFKLSSIHRCLIGTIRTDGFHSARKDAVATCNLDRWIEMQLSNFKLVFSKEQGCRFLLPKFNSSDVVLKN